MVLELRLHSPAGAEPAVYTWPLPVTVSQAHFQACGPFVFSKSLFTPAVGTLGFYNVNFYVFRMAETVRTKSSTQSGL